VCHLSFSLPGTLGYTVYMKITHTDFIYLHVEWLHHLAQKRAVLSTLIHCVWSIFDADSLQDETYKGNFSKTMALAVGTSNTPMHQQQFWTATEQHVGVALLLYRHFTSNKLSRLLAKHTVKNNHISMKKLSAPSDWSRMI